MYDYLIVGAGLFGSVCARELTDNGKKCLVIDKRNHIGGNCYTENINGIIVHKYGPHIFHTSNENIWNYINRYSSFNNYIHKVKVIYHNKIYSFPINLYTMHQLWGIKTPEEAKVMLKEKRIDIKTPKNLEEWALSQVGEDLYNIFIKEYTIKQWSRSPQKLPCSIIKRIPIRLNFNDNYFNDKYQGIPVNGFTKIFLELLRNIDINLNIKFSIENEKYFRVARKIIYTGAIDELFNYKYGMLEYRSLLFEHEIINIADFQGTAVVNYPELSIPYTRIIEHKHFEIDKNFNNITIITREYPQFFNGENIPCYPVNDKRNIMLYNKYRKLAKSYPNIIFGGRLGEYRYYDMDKVILSALNCVKKELNIVKT
jgi:UDP-galactopyranose mutase